MEALRRDLLLPRAARKRPGRLLPWLWARRGFFALLALLLSGMIAFSVLFFPAYVVTVNGVEIGQVAEKAAFTRAAAKVEARVSQLLGTAYHLSAPQFSFIHTYGMHYSSTSSLEHSLLDTVEEIESLYVLRVDGHIVGAGAQPESLITLLHETMEGYRDAATCSLSLKSDVSIRRDYVAKTVEQDEAVIRKALSDGGTAALRVTVSKTATYTEEIPYETRQRETAALYQGERKVETAGSCGKKQVTETQCWENNQLISRSVTAETVTAEPVAEVIAVGTKARPKAAASGVFAWPVRGTITSPFGYRRIFGSTSFHSGVDIANQQGTAIHAADGGTVSFAGTKGSYGTLVILSHGNGTQTYYAHCSALLVKEGTSVSKGETIARMGATGRATGSHLHFEIRVNGKAVNPLPYFST